MAQELSTKNVNPKKLNKPYKEENKVPWWKRKYEHGMIPGPRMGLNGATRIEKGSKLPRLKRK